LRFALFGAVAIATAWLVIACQSGDQRLPAAPSSALSTGVAAQSSPARVVTAPLPPPFSGPFPSPVTAPVPPPFSGGVPPPFSGGVPPPFSQ
jgi:hypothetical protein